MKFRPSRRNIVQFLVKGYLVLLFGMAIGWSVHHIDTGGSRLPHWLSAAVLEYAAVPHYVYRFFTETMDSRLIPDVHSAKGWSFPEQASSASFHGGLLVPTFLEKGELVTFLYGLPKGEIRHRWNIDPETMRSLGMFEWISHPMMMEDSSLVFVSNGLYRWSGNGQLIWSNRSVRFHHAVERSGKDTLWACIQLPVEARHIHGKDTMVNDAIASVDLNTGKLIWSRSLPSILERNGFAHLIQLGTFEKDPLHLNDVQPAINDSPYWKKGDLLISLRNRSTVFLYRPSSDSILWMRTGPWMAQHDVDFVGDSTIMVFGNDVVFSQEPFFPNGHNDIYLYHFGKDSISKPYTRIMSRLGIDTPTQGLCELLPNGDLLVDETDRGKVYILTPDSLKATFTDRYDEKRLRLMFWVRPVWN